MSGKPDAPTSPTHPNPKQPTNPHLQIQPLTLLQKKSCVEVELRGDSFHQLTYVRWYSHEVLEFLVLGFVQPRRSASH